MISILLYALAALIDLAGALGIYRSLYEAEICDERGWKSPVHVIRDEKNHINTSKLFIDRLTFMNVNGYESVQAYIVNIPNTVMYHYIKRKKNK